MLKGKSVNIRPVAERDLEELTDRLSDPVALGEFMPQGFISESNFRKNFHEHGFIRENSERYVVVSKDDELLGSIWIFKSVTYFDSLEMGYYIFEDVSRGKGYATESVKLLTDFIFRSRQLNRLEIRMSVENTASEKVAINAGYTHEGVLREAAFSNGKHHDMNTYSLLRREWAKRW